MNRQNHKCLPTCYIGRLLENCIIALSVIKIMEVSNSGPIKLGNISSSLLTPESYQAPNCAAKIQSAPQRKSSTIYQKRHAQGLVIMLGQTGYCTGSTYSLE